MTDSVKEKNLARLIRFLLRQDELTEFGLSPGIRDSRAVHSCIRGKAPSARSIREEIERLTENSAIWPKRRNAR